MSRRVDRARTDIRQIAVNTTTGRIMSNSIREATNSNNNQSGESSNHPRRRRANENHPNEPPPQRPRLQQPSPTSSAMEHAAASTLALQQSASDALEQIRTHRPRNTRSTYDAKQVAFKSWCDEQFPAGPSRHTVTSEKLLSFLVEVSKRTVRRKVPASVYGRGNGPSGWLCLFLTCVKTGERVFLKLFC